MFLCDYVAIEDFRREIHTLLNRGESVHQLQRAVYSGKVAPERGRRRDETKAISGSHALLTNIVLAWNNARMHEVVVRLRRDGIPVEDDWLRRIGPAHFSHINFRGTMKFGVEKFAAALDPACADPGNWGGIVTSSAIAELRGYRRAVLTTVVKQPKIPT